MKKILYMLLALTIGIQMASVFTTQSLGAAPAAIQPSSLTMAQQAPSLTPDATPNITRETHLKLKGGPELNREALASLLRTRPQLINSITVINFTDEELRIITENCHQLQSLNLAYCHQITDIGLSALTNNCPQLQSLNLSWCDKITDAGVLVLARLTNLQTLYLVGCHQITDIGLGALTNNCPQLQSLNLYLCNRITPTRITQLQQALPRCRILW